ncbi:hypothetical protein BDD12DRAFT_979202 [Trichophaea hybrida]|nr:hypothetical protein BDD12DRAFT_979202 [Trichophaea hybrida]
MFGPLQHYYGKATDDHMRETRTGIVKGTFWNFYSAARVSAYTQANIKSAWRKTGIYPFNPDTVTIQLPGFKTIATPIITRTPRNRREVRHHTNAAIKMVQSGDTNSAISVLRQLAHVAETALSTAEIKTIETEDIRKRYSGKSAARTDRRVLTKARVITSQEVVKLREQREEKERRAAEKKAGSKKKKVRGKITAVAPKKQVTIVIPSDCEDSGHESGRVSAHEYNLKNKIPGPFVSCNSSIISTGRTQHPPIPIVLNTPSNPNPRLPDRPLEMTLRSRERKI